jgi:Glu-tRNA(Gln) amidotransferase subunit E-like FAD-binding protein
METDYKELGFKAGLEIHQQLDSRKLFCNCPSILRKDEPDFEVTRKLHAIAGESGEIDIAAQQQAELGKEFVYQGYDDTTCLVELDEEPPHEINKEALMISLHIALLMNMKIVPITQIMRKTVIDGSNTSGFQRSVLIAQDGYIETGFGKVGIDYLYLEEDAARIVEKTDKKDIYKLDRLGMPLVEIVTAADIKTPEQAKEVALYIGEILRACKVRRGIGTIRQDINVSIRGENRVEIKGMQDMRIFVKVIENEVLRQMRLSDKKNPTKMEVRNAQKDGSTRYMRPLPGSARMYPETDLPLLRISRQMLNEAKKTLPKLKKDVEKELEREGLNREMISLLLKQNKIEEFKELLNIISRPQIIAKTLLIFPKEIARREKISLTKAEKILNKDVLAHVLENLKKKKITENQIKHVLENIVKGKSYKEALEIRKEDLHRIEKKIGGLVKEKPGLSLNAYMGLIMEEFKGVSGKEVFDIIKKYVKGIKK